MKFYYILDEKNCVNFANEYREEIIPFPEWKLADIEGSIYYPIDFIPLYKEENGEIIHRTEEEIQADIDAIPLPELTEIDYLRADVDFLTMENEAFEEQNEQQQADIDYLLMLMEEE